MPKPNRLILGDALSVTTSLESESIDLIYLDPPFCTGRVQSAPPRGGDGLADGPEPAARSFEDAWKGGMDAYLTWFTPILEQSRRCLKPTGSLYVHLDWHASHYVKVELDRLYGMECFLNHIVWLYGLGGSSPRYWPRKHDDILWYARSPGGGHFFEPVMVPARSQRMRGQAKKMPDYWSIPTLNNMAIERVGYPTQKPEALLELIIKSSCPPGGVVADFFAGSGTSCVVAGRLGRAWIACDASAQAMDVIARRLKRHSDLRGYALENLGS